MTQLNASLTQEALSQATSDEKLLEALFMELSREVPASLHDDLAQFVSVIQRLPSGLRAMAATYQLDVSMALDDLGWHFASWHHHAYRAETSRGLRELETAELSELFERAVSLVERQWEVMGERLSEGFDSFVEWYSTSELQQALAPLNSRWWELCNSDNGGLFRYWVAYARKYPKRVVST